VAGIRPSAVAAYGVSRNGRHVSRARGDAADDGGDQPQSDVLKEPRVQLKLGLNRTKRIPTSVPTTQPQSSKVSCAVGWARPDGKLKRDCDLGPQRRPGGPSGSLRGPTSLRSACPRAHARGFGARKVNAVRRFAEASGLLVCRLETSLSNAAQRLRSRRFPFRDYAPASLWRLLPFISRLTGPLVPAPPETSSFCVVPDAGRPRLRQ
jgi:hypothetical protein